MLASHVNLYHCDQLHAAMADHPRGFAGVPHGIKPSGLPRTEARHIPPFVVPDTAVKANLAWPEARTLFFLVY